MNYLGDFTEDDTVYLMFNTYTSDDPSASSTITNFTNTDVHIHKDDGLTQRNNAAGITVSVDFDGITGSHMVKIDTSDDTVGGFWVVGHEYFVRIEGTTIDGATINSVVGHFSIENRFNEVDVVKISGDATAANNAELAFDGTGFGFTNCIMPTVTTLSGHTAQTGDNFARIGATGSGLTTLAQAAVCTEARLAELTAANMPADIDTLLGRVTAAVALASICTDARLAELDGANLPTDVANVKAETALIVADTNELQTDWVNDGRLDLILDIIAADTTTDIPALIAALNNISIAQVKTQADTALSDIHLDHLLATDYDPASKPGTATALLNELVESDGGVSRYTANALEQAPSAGTNPNVLIDTTIAGVTDQTHFTLTAGSNDDDAYKDQSIVIYDASDSDYPSVRKVSAYTGATKTVTLDSAPDFTIVNGDGIRVFVTAPGTTAPTAAQNADAVWDEAQVDHVGAGTFGIVASEVADVLEDTNELQTDWVNDGRLDLILDIIAQDTTTDIPGTITTMQGNVTDILGDTNELQGDWANAGRLDTILDACALEATVAALNNITAANVVDEFETQSQADPTGFHVNVKEINGTAQTANDVGGDVNEILLDTAVIGALGAGLTAVPWNPAWDAEVESEVNDGLVAFFTSAVQLVDDIWDEELTGATHNIVSSAGRRVRELGAYFITGGTAQASTAYGITLAAGESATDHIFNRNLIVILAGTGAGQTRTIVDYNGTSKVAVVDRNWWVNPDATSEYSVIPDDTPLVADHGVATAGGNNTITIRSDASATNDTYAGSIMQIMAGTGRGQSRMIDSYNGTTKVVTICATWITNPDNTSVYVIMPYGVSQTCKISADPLAEIKTQADDALTDIKLDHLIAVADGDDPVDNSIIAMMAASDGDWSGFAIADDSLEAIRDQGDTAWITGAGGAPPTTLQNTTIATLATQVSFTLTAGSADDDAYNGCIVVVEDSATATQKCIGRVLDYTGASKTITLEADPGVFTMDAGDTIDVIAVELTWNAATKALTDKSGFALSAAGIDAFLDEVIGDAVHATPNSVGAMLHAVYCRFMQKRTATDTVEKAYKLDDVTELKSFTLADDDTTTSRT